MAAIGHLRDYSIAIPAVKGNVESWYAVQTRARHERVVAQRFRCYVFVKIMNTNEDRLRVLCTDSVFGFVGVRRQGTPIPDEQIDAVRTIVEERVNWRSYPFLKIGQRVRICSGALSGVEGILVSRNGERSVVVSVDAIQRSLSVRIEGYEIEAA
jgi:transcription antitermination factor NusG